MVAKRQTRQSNGNLKISTKRGLASKVTYAESSGAENSEEDEEFEPVKKTQKLANGKTRPSNKANLLKDIKTKQETKSAQKKVQGKLKESTILKSTNKESLTFGHITCPLLSESDSSDDDMCIADIKTKINEHTSVKEKNIVKSAGKKYETDKKDVTIRDEKDVKGHSSIGLKLESSFDELHSISNRSKCLNETPVFYQNLDSEKHNDKQKVEIFKEKETCEVKGVNKGKKDFRRSLQNQSKAKKHGKGVDSKATGKELVGEKLNLSKTRRTEIKKNPEKGKTKTKSEKTLKVASRMPSTKIAEAIQKKKGYLAHNDLSRIKALECLPGASKCKNEDASSDDESENDWEDVHEAEIDTLLHESPKKEKKKDVEDVSVSLKVKSIHKSKSQKNKEKFLQCVERTMRKFQNQVQTNLHKDHLVCLVARLQFVNKACDDPGLKALWLSMIPANTIKVKITKWEVKDLQRFLNWFQMQDLEGLLDAYQKITGKSRRISQVQNFVAALRATGLLTRLVMSLQPITWKVDNSDLFRLGNGGTKDQKEANDNAKPKKRKSSSSQGDSNAKQKDKRRRTGSVRGQSKTDAKKHTSPYFKDEGEDSDSEIRKELHASEGFNKRKYQSPTKKSSSTISTTESSKKLVKSSKQKIDKAGRKPLHGSTGKVTRVRKKIDYREIGDESEGRVEASDTNSLEENCALDDAYGSDVSDDDDFIEAPKKSLAAKLSEKKSKKSCMPSVDRGYARNLIKAIDDDDDFEKSSKPIKFRKSLNNKADSPTVKIISSDSESCQSKESLVVTAKSMTACDSWCEVYLKSIKKWICIELYKKTIDDPAQCEDIATQPLQYVLGIDNENAIKDVTCRYASKFMSKTRKLRINREWWAETLLPYETKDKKGDELEDIQLKMNLMQQPFPATVGEFKNHPLYVLEGDLLKFEAIYPESPAVLGYFRKKAIYSRDCVHVLHTRENWLKEARVVKQGEKAYKIVKGRPKRNTPVHERDKVKIDLFGFWQTEVYKPPPIKNGKVPRNEYGNVELFKACMLPPGGVHIPIQGIHKTARKLGIDAAPAMMGWDFHGGCAHPIIEGVVVAAEFEVKLLDEWQKDEDERERKLKEKNEKKLLDRWKALVKGLLVRERIRRKYDFREGEDLEHVVAHKDDEKATTDVGVSWPLNKQVGRTSLNEKGHCHVFPESSYKQDKVTGEWTKSCTCGLSLPFEKL